MSAAVRATFAKEIRALLPLWSTCTLLVAATAIVDQRDLHGIAALAYVLGSCTLGAHAFGHEYSHRTLASALAQPMHRRWALAIKLLLNTFFSLYLNPASASGETVLLENLFDLGVERQGVDTKASAFALAALDSFQRFRRFVIRFDDDGKCAEFCE